MLNLEFAHGRSGFSLWWKIGQKTAMEVVDFAVDFCGGFFWSQNTKEKSPKKSTGKPASRKQKVRRRTTPRNPPANPKIPPQNLRNPPAHDLQIHAGFFRLRRIALGGVFRAWILGHSLAAFWAWSRLPC